MNLHPDELFSKIFENATTRKRKTLELIHNACKKQADMQIKDFSLGTIARLISEDGGPSEQALRNKNAEDYRLLINQWAKYYNTSIKKPKTVRTTTVNEDILENISEPTTRALVGMLMADNKKLRKENLLLKEQTNFTIDMRPVQNITTSQDVTNTAPPFTLTASEIDALKNAISEEFINYQGWTTDNYGRIKANGIQLYKAGYITALQKIISEY